MAQQVKLLKLGWLPSRYGLILPALALAAPGAAAPVLFAGGKWAAIDFSSRCEARSMALWPKKERMPFAGFAFARNGRQHGQFYVHLGLPARPGATVIATIGSQPFLLVGKGAWAWSKSTEQQRSMLRAVRYAQSMRVESRDGRGQRIVDRYALTGAATAVDAAAAACAGKSG